LKKKSLITFLTILPFFSTRTFYFKTFANLVSVIQPRAYFRSLTGAGYCFVHVITFSFPHASFALQGIVSSAGFTSTLFSAKFCLLYAKILKVTACDEIRVEFFSHQLIVCQGSFSKKEEDFSSFC
jgi:hypothetical protein